MISLIDGLPANVLGIEASGTLTHKDYVDFVIPLFEKALEKQAPIRVLYVFGPDFNGMDLAAMWDDAAFGVKHWHDISHIALVTEENWIRACTAAFAPFFPGVVRIFGLSQLDEAKEWVSRPVHQEASAA